MGDGYWNDAYFSQRQANRAAAGQDAFVYHQQMQNAEEHEKQCHPAMDLRIKRLRESRDNAEHPESIAITVIFDQTGSMRVVPKVLQQNLDKLMATLIRLGVQDPQVMIGAIGDGGMHEIAPIQVGEWESDIRIDDCLGQLYLEGQGGGNKHESYELALYAMARHTSIDCWEKRQRKAYLFIIGDELPYESIDRHLVKKYIGDDLTSNIPLEAIVEEVKQRFETFFLMPTGLGNYEKKFYQSVERRWRELFGTEQAMLLNDPSMVSEKIAETVSLLEHARRTSRASQDQQAPDTDNSAGFTQPKRRAHITRL